MLSLAGWSFSLNPLGLSQGSNKAPSAHRGCTQSLCDAELTSSTGVGVVVCPTLGNIPHTLAEKRWNKIYSSNSRAVGKEEAKFLCLLCEWIYKFKSEFLMQSSLKFQGFFFNISTSSFIKLVKSHLQCRVDGGRCSHRYSSLQTLLRIDFSLKLTDMVKKYCGFPLPSFSLFLLLF